MTSTIDMRICKAKSDNAGLPVMDTAHCVEDVGNALRAGIEAASASLYVASEWPILTMMPVSAIDRIRSWRSIKLRRNGNDFYNITEPFNEFFVLRYFRGQKGISVKCPRVRRVEKWPLQMHAQNCRRLQAAGFMS